jgi:hypothetical protein
VGADGLYRHREWDHTGGGLPAVDRGVAGPPGVDRDGHPPVWCVYLGAARRWRIESPKQAIVIGLIWLGLTVVFEFLFGHYVMGNPWERLLHDYNLLAGRVWVFVLIWITIAPYVFYRINRQD